MYLQNSWVSGTLYRVRMVGKVNFTGLEKETLYELVESYKNIIESKKNDGRMIEKKERAWEEIGGKYNARHGVSERSIKQLKGCWQNMKKKAKTEASGEKKEKRKTGGGPSTSGISDISQKVIEMLPQQIHSLTNEFDDDAHYHGDVVEVNIY